MVINKNFKYIDLFAGIGGFHNAMNKYSNKSQCIMASEINKSAAQVYKDNFKIEPLGDVRKIDPSTIGDYDVLCAGFPCQTFSKAGNQAGLKDPRGTLFEEIIRIAAYENNIKNRPKILILENVHNLINHDNGFTWLTIKDHIKKAGYNIIDKPIVIGPKDVGIPQLRDRAIILAVRKDIYNGSIDLKIERKKRNTTSIYSIIQTDLSELEKKKYKISRHLIKLLNCWDDFYKRVGETVIGTEIWSDEFKKRYNLKKVDENGLYIIPEWKQKIIQWNRDFYKSHKGAIDKWYEEWDIQSWTNSTERKFEWQCGGYCKSVWEGIIQIRTSGVRVKRPTESPTLVTLNHIPIIGKEKRYITVRESARLQSFPDWFEFNEEDSKAYYQLGNAVNVDVIEYVFRKFIEFLEEKTDGEI